jgi:hypothetical protein
MTVAALVSRGRRAGATGAKAFADWLIIDEEWFGPCSRMDRATYQRCRRRAEAIYAGPPDAYVSARNPFSIIGLAPRANPAATTQARLDPEAARVVKAFAVVLTTLLVVALGMAGNVMTTGPHGDPPSAPDAESERCVVLGSTTCARTSAHRPLAAR